ncbi:MAG TPA: outer-membrane lipoprotein carrier protein LolA [Caulobacteraceae bacterium]|nr:outer-membrane lipoprotein carrier protein LolA [Caulobacteraceae bacterium]
MPAALFRSRRFALAAPVLLVAAGVLGAVPVPPADDAGLVSNALTYLDSIKNARGRFVQTDSQGRQTTGEVWIHRPGKARFQYDPPSRLVIASDGRLVSVLNPGLRSFQNYPLGATPLGLLLARSVRLEHGAYVSGVERRADGFSLTLRRGRTSGALRLDFAGDPLRLAGWTVIDAQGQVTTVRLIDFGPSGPADPRLFDLRNPYRGAPAPP